MNKEKLAWYVNRLKAMTPAEVAVRVRNLAYCRAQKAGFFTAAEPPRPRLGPESVFWINRDAPKVDPGPYVLAAQEILAGEMRVFALENADLDRPPNWNRDPLTRIIAPLDFGKTLDYRDPDMVGDIKYLWEINRHLQLVTLAQAWALTGDKSFLDGLRELLDSWIKACPYLMGANWSSSLELAIRLINWSLAWQITGGADSPLFKGRDGEAFFSRFMDSVYQHMHFLAGWFSGHSSANNHLIGEAAGLLVGAVTWPFWDDCAKWADKGRNILVREALIQNGEDGVNLEQAISYQQFVLDFMILGLLAGEKGGLGFPEKYRERIQAMLEFAGSIMDAKGHMPMIGDADDGYVTCLSREPGFCPFNSLLATGAALFRRPDFGAKSAGLDHKTRWLLGDDIDPGLFDSSPTGVWPVRRLFPDGGYAVLGRDFESEREVKVVADAGPLGLGSLAAHGHADALSFTLSIGGNEIIVDPGTYAYHTQKKWRDYFRGTSAHNTVRVDGRDQSEIKGNFLWSDHAKARIRLFEAGAGREMFCADHDGYARLDDPVIHQRAMVLHGDEGRLVLEDRFDCLLSHSGQWFYHFSELVEVELDGNRAIASAGGVTVEITPPGGSELKLVREGENPPMGWVSRSFDVKTGAWTLVASRAFDPKKTYVTEIKWKIGA